jgi:aminoglycoside phosphotransferase (APT) family kinase protein
VARGEPDAAFPYPWSVYRWLEGELASKAPIGNLTGFAGALAAFLDALGRVDATDGPQPGEHNFFRGGPPATYEGEALEAIDALGNEIRRARSARHRRGPRRLRAGRLTVSAAQLGAPPWFAASSRLAAARRPP